MEFWYFAYGSNLNVAQMTRLIGPMREGAERPRRVRLAGYRLAYNAGDADGRAYANIMPADGQEVLGVIYRCSDTALKRLDQFETGYKRQIVTVRDETDKEIEAMVYVAEAHWRLEGVRPTRAYLERVLAGARDHDLPEDYVAKMLELGQS